MLLYHIRQFVGGLAAAGRTSGDFAASLKILNMMEAAQASQRMTCGFNDTLWGHIHIPYIGYMMGLLISLLDTMQDAYPHFLAWTKTG